MKKYLLLVPVIGLWVGQAMAVELDNDKKRFSYIVGLQVGQQIKSENIDLEETAFMAAIKDVAVGAEPRLSDEEVQETLKNMQLLRAQEIAMLGEKNRQEGDVFLASNKQKKGVKITASGLQYKVIKAGTGDMPKITDTVEVHYRGTLIDGTEFDSSYSRGEPAIFPVNGVIEGWQEALPLMKEGAKWQLYIPSDLAYGPRGSGGNIGANATLIFDVELLGIKR